MTQPSATPSPSPVPAPAVRSGRGKDLALRALQVILGLFFVAASAVPKLVAHSSATESFDEIGLGMWLMYAVGLLELAGGIALATPWLSSLAALGLIALMAGAFVTQLTVFDGRYALTPVLLTVPLALIAWGRRDSLRRLAALLRGADRTRTAR